MIKVGYNICKIELRNRTKFALRNPRIMQLINILDL